MLNFRLCLGQGAQKGPLVCHHTRLGWPGAAAPLFTERLPVPDPEDGETIKGAVPGGGAKNGEEERCGGGCSPGSPALPARALPAA